MPGTNKLAKQKIDAALDTFTQRYSSAYNNAPWLPKPPEGFKFITSAALKSEAYQVAPLGVPSMAAEGKLLEGQLMRINLLYRKAVELRIMHMREHGRLCKVLKMMQYTQLVITSGVSILLLVANDAWVAKVSSIATIIVGLIVSWTRFQSLEARSEMHMISSLDFESLARDMSTYLTICRPEQVDDEALDALHNLAKDMADHQDILEVKGTASDQSMNPAGPGPVAESDEAYGLMSSPCPAPGAPSSSRTIRPSVSMMQRTGETSLERVGRNKRLQIWYHKSIEYRLANNMLYERNKMISMFFGFVSLILTGAIQTILVIDNHKTNKTVSAVISAVLTAINAVAARGNFDGRAQSHAVSMREFANLQWELASVLLTTTSDQEEHDFGPLSVQFNNAISSMPVLDDKFLKKQRTSDGKVLFEYITETALRDEAESDPSAHALESLKEAYRAAAKDTVFKYSAATDLVGSSSAKVHPFPDGGV